jgi:hypothetical protein
MQEQLLHYIWKTRSYNLHELSTTNGEPIQVLRPGNHNVNAGPDFAQASIKIDQVHWTGSVEIHIKSSDWYVHHHEKDPAYENVILHIVWQHDKDIRLADNSIVPTLELSNCVDHNLLDRFDRLMKEHHEILCHKLWNQVPPITQLEMIERAAIERLQIKAKSCNQLLDQYNGDWEETTYHMIMGAYGMKVNKPSFLKLAGKIPFKVIRKSRQHPIDLDALLFGQSGLLPSAGVDTYSTSLIERHKFLTHKHDLSEPMLRVEWKFSKMRPANFPTIRLAQLATFYKYCTHFFDVIMHTDSLDKIRAYFTHEIPDYWLEHADFGKAAKSPLNTQIGKQMYHHLIINVFAPVLATAANHFGQPTLMDKALTWLEQLPPESNKITRHYESLNYKPHHALQSQGLLTLYDQYCIRKKCLSCSIGASIIDK